MPEKGPHGKYATTLTWSPTDRATIGIDYRPESDDLTPLVSYRLFNETKKTPAVIAGLSADEFDKEISEIYHLIFSKRIAKIGETSLSGYVGPMYIATREELTVTGGGTLRHNKASLMGMWSGEHFHLVGNYDINDHISAGVVWWGLDTFGVRMGVQF
ncbi:MAG: hypothetical protein AAF226_18500 [Verrucomicrobiota bacterium]